MKAASFLLMMGLSTGLAFGRPEPRLDVQAVFPSGTVISDRLLRITIIFSSAPPAEVMNSIELRDMNGAVLQNLFVNRELWSPDGHILTLIFAPGRIKSGLIAHDVMGSPLRAGDSVNLFVGTRLVKSWNVETGGCAAPNPASWRFSSPLPGTVAPILVDLSGPLDWQSRNLIAVVNSSGQLVKGQAYLEHQERVWRFAPSSPWRRGTYQLAVHPRIENACGDEPGEPFEHQVQRGLGAERVPLQVQFSIR